MKASDEKTYSTLAAFWDRAFAMTDEERETAKKEIDRAEDWKSLAPSAKLFDAAASLGKCARVLDYGCGTGWAGLIAAKCGCSDVLCADVTPNGIAATAFYADLFDVADRVHTLLISPDWLAGESANRYDGLLCSNVLDVVPTEMAKTIIREMARVVTNDATVVIGLNYYMDAEAAAARGITLKDGNLLLMDGVLRLVSRSDEEWTALFAPYFTVEKLDHFAWAGEPTERRRLFYLKKRK